ncbi:N-6 DNA methylase [Hymenobacter tibetensis]|uniref:site-specific DNA-methyltransferase (adenine-specific) n=1 Tax=Hymenobacter tibetensis TaxID=497967 RepID=A0ABY4CW40_9BACT|nr:TaqI-like C-terminal specificity domain-containing protein [Hymenobacter tibetensis]UOG73211.1 N-6 DNA methylase [Hymenobacter tibetensis]
MFQPLSKEQARLEMARLVENFTYQLPDFKRGKSNETEVRVHYINPFFKALGWDVNNDNGASPAYCEVVHEARVKIGKASKAPDYLFRLPGGQNLFFLEAKKPSVNIKGDVQPAYQVRRYGWNAKMALSLLTDFEELAVYDCSIQPGPKDKSSKARLHYFTFDQYAAQFDFLWDNFSRESVYRGNLDRFVASGSGRRGKETVDRAFLDTLEQMRAALAQGLAARNSKLDAEQMRFLVQMLLDRIIFLRIAEDRGVEPEDDLKKLASIKAKDGIYLSLLDRFRAAAARYNSGLFDLDKDTLSAEVRLDNTTLKPLLDGLYYPESPYEFSVIGAEILGSAYERFLGKVIQLQPDRTVIIEEKPEVRKAGGVFYTPAYIVEYIVKNTVGKLCEGSSPQQIAKLRIVDPACGSGSFLLGAYQFLLDWHLAYYQTHPTAALPPTLAPAGGPKKAGKPARPTGSGKALTPDGHLTTAVKKTILLNNLYGVDLDEQAVEVTKLSLLLKCLEGETSASMQQSLGLERVLPTIDQNIRVGNSLVDVDFYDQELNFGTERAVKPFSWRDEFAEVFQQGGFDAVIGNPPYLGGREWKEENGNQYDYFTERYAVAETQFDMYVLFWERGISLAKKEGYIGYITPNTWLNNKTTLKLRSFILNNTVIEQIIDYSSVKVFDQATVLPVIALLKNNNPSSLASTTIIRPDKTGELITLRNIRQTTWNDAGLKVININLEEGDNELKDKIASDTKSVQELAEVKFGIKIYETGKGKPAQVPEAAKNHIFESNSKINSSYRHYLEGKDIHPFFINWKNKWLSYGSHLAAPRDPKLFEGERILVRRIVGERLIASYTNDDFVTSQLLQIIKPHSIDSKYLLGIISSTLIAYYFKKKYNRLDKVFPEIRIYELANLPVKITPDQHRHDAIVTLAEQLLTLHPQLRAARLATEQSQLQARIRRLDQRLDHLVYLLYGLSYTEAQIIEPAIAQRLTEAQYAVWPSN